uniref:Uncharacterized protein n=1 Tax=Rhizophora mucronata TaxID=61149 RepID=A0A2P2JAN3_RHIMU
MLCKSSTTAVRRSAEARSFGITNLNF